MDLGCYYLDLHRAYMAGLASQSDTSNSLSGRQIGNDYPRTGSVNLKMPWLTVASLSGRGSNSVRSLLSGKTKPFRTETLRRPGDEDR
jgi:hypothetical protein